MRLKLLLAGLLTLAPLPALADVTAYYAGAGGAATIEVDDGGNFRAEFGKMVTLIRRDGVDYLAVEDPAGKPKVVRVDEMLTLIRAQIAKPESAPPAEMMGDFALVGGGDETVAGYAGTVWRFGPAGKPSVTGQAAPGSSRDQVDLVMSADPKLAPIGAVFRHLFESLAPVLEPALGQGNFMTLAGELAAKGTPIRIGPVMALARVDTADIASARFELPGPVLPAAELMAMMRPPAPAPMSPLP